MSLSMKRVAVVMTLVALTVACTATAGVIEYFTQVNLGDSCSESSGAVKWSQFVGVVVCKGGKYKYAIPGDFPATPAGG